MSKSTVVSTLVHRSTGQWRGLSGHHISSVLGLGRERYPRHLKCLTDTHTHLLSLVSLHRSPPACAPSFAYRLLLHTNKQKPAFCGSDHQLSLKQTSAVLCFTFICFSLAVVMHKNNTITLGDAQLCSTMKNLGAGAEQTLRGCRMGNWRILNEESAVVYFKATKHSGWHET